MSEITLKFHTKICHICRCSLINTLFACTM